MKKILILALALLFCILSIALISCEDEEESSESEKESSSSEVPSSSTDDSSSSSSDESSSSEQESSSSSSEDESTSSSSSEENSSSNTQVPNEPVEPHICEYGEWQTVTKATCTQKGLKRKACSCGDYVDEEIPATGIHEYEFGKCKHCKTEQPASQGLEFELDMETDTYIVTDIGSCADTSLVIPSTYEGKPVTSIGEDAFERCDSLTSVIIPNSVTLIGEYAFYHCDSLTSVTIPNSVTLIGKYAFRYCSLTSVTIGNSITSIGIGAFYDCYKLVEVYNLSSLNITIGSDDNGNVGYYAKVIHTSLDEPSILETVDDYIFMAWEDKCYLMGYVGNETELTLPDSYKGNNYEIYKYAFYNRDDITKVTIPDSVTSIGSYAFRGCDSLTSVNYLGTIEQWCNISFGEYDANPLSNGAKLYLNETLVTELAISNTVTKIKDYAFYNCKSLTSVTISNSATSIGEDAFRSCTSLTSVTIGNSVTEIGSSAFYKCTSLTSVNYLGTIEQWCNISFGDSANPLCNGANLFLNGTLVTDLVIPSTVTEIKNYSFYGCSSLTSVTIPNSVTSIGKYAFRSCTSLTSVTIPNSVTSIGSSAFSDCASLEYNEYDNSYYLGNDTNPYLLFLKVNDKSISSCIINENTKFIHSGAFTGCSIENAIIPTIAISHIPKNNLKTLVINGGTSIEESAFYNRDSLTSIIIGDSVISIGDSAFGHCDSLTSVNIGNGVTSIGRDAFSYCNSLTSVTIGNSVTSIEDNAFVSCYSLTSLNYLGTIEQWCNISFYNYGANPLYYAQKLYLNETLVTDLVIPSTVTEIKDYAFYNCYSLANVTIPNSVTLIGSDAFYSCDSLTSITIGNSVTSIESYAFNECTSLTSVTIGNSVTSIGGFAFHNCKLLTSVNYLGTIEQWCNISFGEYYSNPLYYGAKLYLNETLTTDIVMPNTITEIKAYAFQGCSSLTSVIIPTNVTLIGDRAFYQCASLSIYCEAESQPSGWSSSWNYSNRPVYWYSENEPTVSGNYWHYGDNGEIVVWAQN